MPFSAATEINADANEPVPVLLKALISCVLIVLSSSDSLSLEYNVME